MIISAWTSLINIKCTLRLWTCCRGLQFKSVAVVWNSDQCIPSKTIVYWTNFNKFLQHNLWVSIVSSSSWSFYNSKIKAFHIFTGTVPVVKECVLTLKRYLGQRWRSGILNSPNLLIFLGQIDPQDVYRNSSHSGLGTNSVMGRGCAVTLNHFCPIIHQFL